MEKSFIVKVEKNGINVPLEKLEANENELMEIKIQRVYTSKKIRREVLSII